MIPIFNLRGYTAEDPLDRAPAPVRFLIAIAVCGVVAFSFLYVEDIELQVTTLTTEALWTGIAIYALVVAPMLVVLRKSSSLLFYLLIVGVSVPVDIFLQAHYREQGLTAPWFYDQHTFLSGIPIPLRFLVAWSFDGIIQGPIALWLTRLVTAAIYPARESKVVQPTFEQQEKLFPEALSSESIPKSSRDAGFWVLRLLGFGYLAYMAFCLIGLLGATPWPQGARLLIEMTYANPALGINTFSKISLMVLLAFIGAYNRNVRWHCTVGLIAGHSASTIASLAFYFFAPGTDYHSFLLTSALVDGAMVLIFGWLLIAYRKEARQFAPEREFIDYVSLPDQMTRIFFYALSAALALSLVGIVLLRAFGNGSAGPAAVYGYPDPQLANTITRFSTMCVLAYLLANREKLRNYLTSVLVLGFAITLVGSSIFLLVGTLTGQTGIQTRSGSIVTVDWYFVLQVAGDALILGALMGLRKMVYNVDYLINALNPSTAQNVVALHEALYGGDAVLNDTVLHKIDDHVAGVQGKKRGLLNFPFWIVEHFLSPIYGFHPTFSNMSREEGARFLRKYILRPPSERARAFIPLAAGLSYQIGTAVYAFATFAHYTTPQGWEEVGYIPPYARDRLQGDQPALAAPLKQPAPLPDGPASPANNKPDFPKPTRPLVAPRVSTSVTEPQIPAEVDYLIVGSGAGGACMAYRLACQVGNAERILVVESGKRFSPLQDFSDDEMEMIRKLYKEGGLQTTKRFDLMVLQGECVGGTTVINNAVCLPMPQRIRDLWRNEYGLSLSEIFDEVDSQGRVTRKGEYSVVAQEIDISEIPDAAINQRVKEKFKQGVQELIRQGASLKPAEVLHCNQRDMVGDGLDNLGNKRLRKRSMLETYLPWAEARGVKIVGGTSAVSFIADRSGKRAEAVLLRSAGGSTQRVVVKKAVIVSGGVIASSQFLMNSGVKKNVGRGMACNFAFPFALDFPDVMDAFDGVQITLGAFDLENRAAFETYFNPPGAFALSLPFYFNRRHDLMKRYRHLTNFGALVGSESNGTIQLKGDALNGRPFSWELGARDRENIKYALSTLLDLGSAAGATRAIPPTEPGIDIPLTAEGVARFKRELAAYPLRMADMHLYTAHPQGGNMMVGDNSPHRSERVVDSSFRVEGFENLFIADASVFPSGITINPQWTIMALSSLAARHVLGESDARVLTAKG